MHLALDKQYTAYSTIFLFKITLKVPNMPNFMSDWLIFNSCLIMYTS